MGLDLRRRTSEEEGDGATSAKAVSSQSGRVNVRVSVIKTQALGSIRRGERKARKNATISFIERRVEIAIHNAEADAGRFSILGDIAEMRVRK